MPLPSMSFSPTTRHLRRRRLLGMALVVALATTFPAAVQAGAADPVAVAPTGNASLINLPFVQLGLSDSYSFATNGASVGVVLPKPLNLTPEAITGSVLVPANLGSGNLVLQAGGTYLSSFSLPPNSSADQVVPFSLSAVGAPVSSSYVPLTITFQQAGGGLPSSTQSLSCGGGILPLTIKSLIASYTGSIAAPTTIAGFLPPVLSTLLLYVPTNATASEQQTALNVAVGVVHLYPTMPVHVVLRPWDGTAVPPAPTDVFTRAVAIQDSSETGAVLPGDPAPGRLLVVTGTPSRLSAQAQLLTGPLSQLAMARTAIVEQPSATPTVIIGTQTFSQLGITGNASFTGTQQLTFAVGAPQLGGVVSNLAMNLRAQYSPVEKGAKGDLRVSVGGVVVATSALDSSGVLNLPVTIPAPLISRSTNVVVQMTYFPSDFSCSHGSRTMSFSIDPRSTVSPTLDTGGVGGFSAVPQALLPSVDVAFDQPSLASLSAGISTLTGIQRLSGVLLHPKVVTWSTGTASSAPLVAVGDAKAMASSFSAPLEFQGRHVYRASTPIGGAIRVGARLAAIEVFADVARNRTVVSVSTTQDWSVTDRLFAWLGDTPTKWSSLTGDVLVGGTTGDPVNLTIRAGAPATFVPTSSAQWWLIAAAALFVLVALGLLAWFVRVLLRRRSSER